MSSTFHAVVRGPSLTGFGKRPVLIPAHQVERPTGIGPRGARIEASRTKPVRGRECLVCSSALFELEFFNFDPFLPEDGAGGDVFLEFAAARGRVDPLFAECGFKPARAAPLAGGRLSSRRWLILTFRLATSGKVPRRFGLRK